MSFWVPPPRKSCTLYVHVFAYSKCVHSHNVCPKHTEHTHHVHLQYMYTHYTYSTFMSIYYTLYLQYMYIHTMYTHSKNAHTYCITSSRLRYTYSTLTLCTIYLYAKYRHPRFISINIPLCLKHCKTVLQSLI